MTHIYLLIFIGCGLGGLLRYLASEGVNSLFGSNFPYGTLFVNVSGSFLMGLIFTVILNKFGTNLNLTEQMRATLLTGFLGGYTTFSSFSLETINLIKTGGMFVALLYISSSIIVCIGFAWIGILLGRQF